MWANTPLSQLCDILDNRRKPITKKDRSPGPYPYYGATGVLDYVEGYLFDEQLVLIGEDGAKWNAGDNSAFSVRGKTWVNNHAHVIRPHREKVLDKWLIYYLNGEDLSDFITGMTVPKLNQGKLKEIPIPLPPIPEQQRIVAILDQAFADIEKARANAEQNLKNARELFDSYLNQVFSQRGEGWVETNLASIAENLDSRRVPITKSERTEGEYPYYGASGIVDYVSDFLFDEELLLISEDGANLLARTYPIAFAASGKYWVNNHAHVLRFKNSKEQKFIEYYLNSISLAPFVSGMAQPKLNQKSLNNIPVPMALPIIVDAVVGKLNVLAMEVEKLEGAYKNKLSSLDELKKSLLQKAFSGELTKNKGIAA